MKRPELESALEDRCVAKIEAAGGMALKLRIDGVRGLPDRTVLLPTRVLFMEFKRLKTGRPSTQQHAWRKRFEALGFEYFFIDTDEQFDTAMKDWL